MARTVGIDIGTFSIKVCALSRKGKGYRLEAIGITLNPLGALPGDDEGSQNQVAEAVKKLLSDTKLARSKANLALPESQVYTRIVEMPVLSDRELASAIGWEAEQYIPVPIDQVNIDYEVVSRPGKGEEHEKMQVFLVASPKNVVNRTVGFANKFGVEVVGLETEMLAVARAMVPDDADPNPTMLVHFGAGSTTLSVVKDGMLVLTHSIESGGMALTRVLASELGLEVSRAEEYKRSYGLDTTQLEGKVAASLKPMVDRSVMEHKKAIQYYNSRNQANPVKRMILSGGSALLPGLVSYMAETVGLEVVLGNAFSQIEPSPAAPIPVDTVSFATVVGLAMRGI